MITAIEHGTWERYTPDSKPEGFPDNAMYCKREQDGEDWYKYINTPPEATPWIVGSVKATVIDNILQAVNRDESMLFPQGALVIEFESTEENPQEAYHGWTYDPETKTISWIEPVFTPPPPPVVVSMLYLADTRKLSPEHPGNGAVAWSKSTQVDSTSLSIASMSEEGVDYGNYWGNPGMIGTRITIQNQENAAQVQRFNITGVTANAGWFVLDVIPVDAAGGLFSDNQALLLIVAGTGIEPSPPQSAYSALVKRVAALEAKLK